MSGCGTGTTRQRRNCFALRFRCPLPPLQRLRSFAKRREKATRGISHFSTPSSCPPRRRPEEACRTRASCVGKHEQPHQSSKLLPPSRIGMDPRRPRSSNRTYRDHSKLAGFQPARSFRPINDDRLVWTIVLCLYPAATAPLGNC